MNIKLLSDLHLEFDGDNEFDPGEGDVLILAGDICLADDIQYKTKEGERFLAFFDKCVENYNQVFYTFGNHEYYYSDLKKAQDIIREAINPEVKVLNNEAFLYEGVWFVGTTLWANFNGGFGEDMEQARLYMNDYHIIMNGTRKLEPEDILKEHDDSFVFLSRTIPTLDGPVVVFSHHAPSYQSFGSGYGDSVQSAYATNLEGFIGDNENIKVWCHGHIHESNNYQVYQCQVVSNPRGYNPNGLNEGFDINHSLTLTPQPAIIKE